MLPTTFLFLDECTSESLNIAALTGVIVPSDLFPTVRDNLCGLVRDVLAKDSPGIPRPIELHARDLLRELTNINSDEHDRLRLAVFEETVRIVNSYELRVIRIAYSNWTEIKTVMNLDPNLYGLNFTNILFAIQDMLAHALVVPVMDGIPGCPEDAVKGERVDPQLIRAFALNVRQTHHFRQYPGMASSISIRNYENLAEPLFADSRFSMLIQLVDLVSYLLHQIEREECDDLDSASSFRQDILTIAKQLNPQLVFRSLQKLTIEI